MILKCKNISLGNEGEKVRDDILISPRYLPPPEKVYFLKWQRIYKGCDPTLSTYLEAESRRVKDRRNYPLCNVNHTQQVETLPLWRNKTIKLLGLWGPWCGVSNLPYYVIWRRVVWPEVTNVSEQTAVSVVRAKECWWIQQVTLKVDTHFASVKISHPRKL